MRRGFTLIERLVSLVIMCVITLAVFESFRTSKRVFLRLQDVQENRMAAMAALDKIRSDVLAAGRGLGAVMRMGLVEGIVEDGGGYSWIDAEAEAAIESDIAAGQKTVFAAGAADFPAGRSVCLHDGRKGETAIVLSADASGVVLASPLAFDYCVGKTSMILLRRVSVYLDSNTAVLRRKVNTTSAQPLLEGVAAYSFDFVRATSLAAVRLSLKGDGEITYDASMVAKNLALAQVKNPV